MVEDMQEFDAEFIELMHRQLLNSSPLMRPDRLGTFPVVIAHKQRVLELMAQLDAAQASAALLLLPPAAPPSAQPALACSRLTAHPHRRPPSERRARRRPAHRQLPRAVGGDAQPLRDRRRSRRGYAGLKAAGDGLGDKAQAQRKLFCAQELRWFNDAMEIT